MNSLVIPVYKNEGSIPDLLQALDKLNSELDGMLEVVFVVDSSPDDSYNLLKKLLPSSKFKSQLLLHSRNYGSFIAIKTGLAAAKGPFYAVMAADLQEPPELIRTFFKELASEECDVVVGTRTERADPLFTRLSSSLFWKCYRKFIDSSVPEGGVDIFGCNEKVRDQLVKHNEANSSLVGLLFWLGFRRKSIPYERQERMHGKSAWTLSKKLKYLSDSMYAFSDLPIRLLTLGGGLGLFLSGSLGAFILSARLLGWISVPGYAGVAVMVLFFAALNLFSLGILGGYVWRTFENTKNRTYGIVSIKESF